MRYVGAAARLAGWGVVALLGLLAIARAVAWDADLPPLIGLHGLGPFPYVVALPVAVAALAFRRVALGLVALAVAAAMVPTGLPELAARDTLPPGIGAAPKVRILSWNLYQGNRDAAAIDRVVRDAGADIVLLQELSARNIDVVRSSPALAAYAHSFTTPQPSAFGSGIWSRLPLQDAGEIDVAGLPMTRASVETPGGTVRLYNVHTLSPVTRDGLALWPRQLHRLGQEVDQPGPPIVLAGDFNATWGHRPFRRLLDTGLVDAGAARGRPWSATWPARGSRILRRPALRLDHVLTGPGLVATTYTVGPSAGSDHRSVVVDVAVQPERA
jgi:endonuclease/exonuclease/phosphatase (EEP) superfamily protein YafD